ESHKTPARIAFLFNCRWNCQPAVHLFRDLSDPVQVCIECSLDIHITFTLVTFTNLEDRVKGTGIKPQDGSQAINCTSLGWWGIVPQSNQRMPKQRGEG